ncbi:MAG: ABC transporter ATP-binding protein [Acidimicrobiia bacterium]|nr:ABC transporter ATP-binding protein [Acidimicrobiia bacterium]
MLEIENLSSGYGDFQALFDVDVTVDEGETLAIIGANGAGKTTLLRTISGLVPAWSGTIRFDGRDLLRVAAHKRVGEGIAMVPEGRLLFPSLNVRENLLVGAYGRRPGTWTIERVVETFPLLEPLLDRPSSVLSGGERQAVAIGRALMANPRLILLDELSLGLAPIVVKQVYAALPAVTGAGTTALVVEQDIGLAMEVADRVTCFLEGRVSLQGTPETLGRHQITAAYFGLEQEATESTQESVNR